MNVIRGINGMSEFVYFTNPETATYTDLTTWEWTTDINYAYRLSYDEINALRSVFVNAKGLDVITVSDIEIVSISTMTYFMVRECLNNPPKYKDPFDSVIE